MTWSSRYTIDPEGNRTRKSTYEPHIQREGYFFHDLREEELLKKEYDEKQKRRKDKGNDFPKV